MVSAIFVHVAVAMSMVSYCSTKEQKRVDLSRRHLTDCSPIAFPKGKQDFSETECGNLECLVYTPTCGDIRRVVFFLHDGSQDKSSFKDMISIYWNDGDHIGTHSKIVFLQAPHPNMIRWKRGFYWANYACHDVDCCPYFQKNGSTDFHCYNQEDYSASSAGVADAIQKVKGSVDSSELYLLGYSQGGWMAYDAAFNTKTHKVGGVFSIASMPLQPVLAASKGKELVGTGKLAVGVWQPGKDEKFGTKPNSSTLASEPGQEDAIFYIRDKNVLDNLGLVNNVKVGCQNWNHSHANHATAVSAAALHAFYRMILWNGQAPFENECPNPDSAPPGRSRFISFDTVI